MLKKSAIKNGNKPRNPNILAGFGISDVMMFPRKILGTLNSIFSTAVSTIFWVTLKRLDIANITSFINISGAEAPAVISD